jgi:outer membrane receptor protein involved in Fe transport
MRWLDRDYSLSTDVAGDGNWSMSPLSNSLGFEEGVHAVYALMSQGVKKWDFQAGLRGEFANRTFSLGADRYPHERTSVYPSAVASYNVSTSTQAKASYSRRVRRPGTGELNPFPTYFDADNVFFGNPDLNPEYTDAFEFGVTKNGAKVMLQALPFFRRTSDVIRVDINTADTLDSREVTSISFRNLDVSNSWGSDLTGQFRLSPKFSAIANFSLFRVVTDGGSTSAVTSDAVSWTGRLNITSEVTKTLTLQAAYNYRAPMKIERGEFAAQQQMNLSLRKKVQGDKGAIMVRVLDPFEMIRFRIRTGDENVMQLTARNPESRMFFLGYQYNFGRPPRVRTVAPESTGGGSVGFGGGPPGQGQ